MGSRNRHRWNKRLRHLHNNYPTVLTVALMLQCCVCRRLWRYVLCLNSAFYSKSYYWHPIGSRIWEIDWYQNEWPWPLFRGRIKVMSTIALYLTLNISETVTDRGLVPKDTNRKWHMGYQMVTWPMTTRDPQRCCDCEAVWLAILATAWLLVCLLF